MLDEDADINVEKIHAMLEKMKDIERKRNNGQFARTMPANAASSATLAGHGS